MSIDNWDFNICKNIYLNIRNLFCFFPFRMHFFSHTDNDLQNLMQYFISILSYATYAIRCVIFPFFVHSGLFYLQGPKNFLFSFNFLECLFSIQGMETICIPGMENFQDSSKKEMSINSIVSKYLGTKNEKAHQKAFKIL